MVRRFRVSQVRPAGTHVVVSCLQATAFDTHSAVSREPLGGSRQNRTSTVFTCAMPLVGAAPGMVQNNFPYAPAA
jgi:hypothetical protein